MACLGWPGDQQAGLSLPSCPVGPSLRRVLLQIVALPAVELVTSGQVQARDIKACDEKVDIWALGVTLYELLTGARSMPTA